MSLPVAELWSKFKSAILFARGVVEAGVAIVQRAPASQTPHALLTAQSGTSAAPTLATHGASIEGWRTINLCSKLASGSAFTADVAIYLYAGAWYYFTTLSITEADGVLDALDTEGFQRIGVAVTAHTGDPFGLVLFPHNEA